MAALLAHASLTAPLVNLATHLIGSLGYAGIALLMTITGIVGSHRVKTKAAGINIDLYTGIGMIVFAAVMITWALLRPTVAEPDDTQGDDSGQIRGAAAT